MTQENIVGPGQKEAAAPLAAMSEAEQREKAKAELSDLRDQFDQTRAEADQAHEMIKCLGNKARRIVADYCVEDDVMAGQKAFKTAYAWVEESLASLNKPDGTDKPEREDSPVSAALFTLLGAVQRLRRLGVNVGRMEMKVVELMEMFDIAREIVGKV
jgi:hypothetical protein